MGRLEHRDPSGTAGPLCQSQLRPPPDPGLSHGEIQSPFPRLCPVKLRPQGSHKPAGLPGKQPGSRLLRQG